MSNYDVLYAKFQKFDQDNPMIFNLLIKFAEEAHLAGVYKTSISLLVERIRWEIQIVTKSEDKFKISNSHRAFYARKLMNDFPEFDGLFTIKEQK